MWQITETGKSLGRAYRYMGQVPNWYLLFFFSYRLTPSTMAEIGMCVICKLLIGENIAVA